MTNKKSFFNHHVTVIDVNGEYNVTLTNVHYPSANPNELVVPREYCDSPEDMLWARSLGMYIRTAFDWGYMCGRGDLKEQLKPTKPGPRSKADNAKRDKILSEDVEDFVLGNIDTVQKDKEEKKEEVVSISLKDEED